MRVYHPQGLYQGMAPENVFIVSDDMGTEVGVGYVIFFYQPDLYPERPVNLYIGIESQLSARYMLFGAVFARARQLRDQYPYLRARIYTQTAVDDAQGSDFYLRNGFLLDDAEDMVRLEMPEGQAKLPMSCSIANIPLTSEYEQNAMLYRINQYRVSQLNLGILDICRQQPHFVALGLYRSDQVIGELIMTGAGYRCEVVAMYITSTYRKMGMGKALLHRAMDLMRQEGVSQVNAMVLRRSAAQCALARSFNAKFIKTTALYPGINID